MAVVALPKFVAFQSKPTGKYLRYLKEDGEVHGYVQFSAENVVSPDTKFEVHDSKSGHGLVHLRSCYNNKYLVTNVQVHQHWIVAKAEQQEEDQSKGSCTLFKPTSVGGDPKEIRLIHVHRGNNLCLWTTDQPYYACVLADYSTPDGGSYDVFNFIDWQSLVMLPKYVAFKGDNGKYLGAEWIENHEYLQFSTDDVAQNPAGAGSEIIRNPNGTIRIKSLHWGKFWRRSPNWIWGDSTDTTTNNKDTLFEPVKYENSIALRNLGNNLFCTRLTTEGKTSCLNANASTINLWARFEVSELIASREIQNVNFRLMDSRIYDERILTMASATAVNRTQSTLQETVDLTHTETRTSTWNASVSLKLGAKATYDVGIPLIFDGKIEMSAEIAGQYSWGETKQTTDTVATKYNLIVRPMTKVTARMLATQGSCDVPFSYTQRDVLYDGRTVTTVMDDGVYSGVNSYSAYIEVKEEPVGNQSNVAPAEFKRVAKVLPAVFVRVAP